MFCKHLLVYINSKVPFHENLPPPPCLHIVPASLNIVISWLYRTCWNSLATSLIISTRLLQIVNSLFHTCRQLGTSQWRNSYELYPVRAGGTQAIWLPGGTLNWVARRPCSYNFRFVRLLRTKFLRLIKIIDFLYDGAPAQLLYNVTPEVEAKKD